MKVISTLKGLPFLSLAYLFFILGVFFFSFTHVDLGLTLTRASIFTDIQRAFQSIGYFQRPLSAGLFITGILLFTLFYSLFIKYVKEGILSRRILWTTIIISTLILTFSYNLLSHDIFNYIFDAKIVTYYGENPYEHKALDYPSDPMLSFMHWTHRTYPYGPVWLGLTVPISFLGLHYFLPTFFLFKILMALGFLLAAYSVEKILMITHKKYALLGLTLFAFNPLIIMESLVSAHNDIVMMAFALYGILLFIQNKHTLSFFALLFSIGIKYATGFLAPLLAVIFFFKRKKIAIPWDPIFEVFVVTMICAVIAASLRTNFQPWYLLYVLPFLALVSQRSYAKISLILLSLLGLLNYVPYLYTGNWDPPIPYFLLLFNSIVGFGILVSSLFLRLVKK